MLQTQLFYDSSPNGFINQRLLTTMIQFASQLALSDGQKKELLNALVLQAKKLLAIWIHYDRFAKEVDRLKPKAPIYEKTATGHVAVSYSQELYLEFDEFLVQYKSSLDYLAKLPATLLGWNKWNPRTFGDGGKRIIKMLRSVLPKSKKFLADQFETLFFEKHRADIEMVVEMRDKINHFVTGGIPYENFRVVGIRQGEKVEYQVPMWREEQTISDFMSVVFHNHLKFCEDFIVFFFHLYLKPGWGFLHRPVAPDSTVSPWVLIPEAALPLYVGKPGGSSKSAGEPQGNL